MDTGTSATAIGAAGFGGMLREWRRMRGSSQLDLALHCGLSQRHLSFLESGRSRPSRGMVLHLASALDVPLREQNTMLLAAGFAPVFRQRSLDAPDMQPIDRALDHVLGQQEPYPAIVIDALHTIVRANRALLTLMGFLTGGAALPAPLNAVEAILRPDMLRGAVENWAEVAAWMARRLRAEALLEGADAAARSLLERVLPLPGVAQAAASLRADHDLPPTLVLWLRRGDTRLGLFSMIATVGTPLDVALQGLRLELFFPADDATAQWFRREVAD
ncbi:MAG: helix-turn-helix transcriptional regulator [Burkholderiales bacterium]|nr:helix-turn-helix transcriptional regulator [Burkholderiales bacterium]